MPYKDSEERKAYMRAWREKNKEHISQYDKKRNETSVGKKSNTISKWKQRGIIHDDYSGLYEKYIATTHCQVCQTEFKDSFDRCLDHDHDSGKFRQFLCRDCNNQDRWKLKNKILQKGIENVRSPSDQA
jgi:hypothetical protein